MAFNGTEGEIISQEDAEALTSNFRSEFSGQTQGVFFGKEVLDTLLTQDGAIGIRGYFGLDESGKMTLVLAAAKTNEDDILDNVADQGVPCPNRCGSPNFLNS